MPSAVESLFSTKQLEPEPGDMVKNPQVVYDKAEEMAEKYRERMLQQSQPKQAPVEEEIILEDSAASDRRRRGS